MTLPRIQPIAPTWRKEPVDDPDWLFDLNYDGFRGLTYIDPGRNRLTSRNRHTFDRFDGLTGRLASLLSAFLSLSGADGQQCGSGQSPECVIRANEGKEFDNDRNPRIARPPPFPSPVRSADFVLASRAQPSWPHRTARRKLYATQSAKTEQPPRSAIPLAELTRKLDAVPDGPQVMLEQTIPDVPDFYSALTNHTGLPTP